MPTSIKSVEVVSDGIVIEFGDGRSGYFSGGFLHTHRGIDSNLEFLPYDPSETKRRQDKRSSSLLKSKSTKSRSVPVTH
ncbi:MAG TPA: hypothetical protein VGD59_03940 [Acidisarcina sp.]